MVLFGDCSQSSTYRVDADFPTSPWPMEIPRVKAIRRGKIAMEKVEMDQRGRELVALERASQASAAAVGSQSASVEHPQTSGVGINAPEHPSSSSRSSGFPSNQEPAQGSEQTSTHVEEPWNDPRYQYPPTGKTDSWDTSMVLRGWLLRNHPTSRKRLFHPLHGSVPIPADNLTQQRITVRILPDGTRWVSHDQWLQTQRTADGNSWRGFTFFKVNPAAVQIPNSAPTGDAHFTVEEVQQDQDSFEIVDERS